MKKILKIAVIVLALLFLLLIAGLTVLTLANLHDEPLDPALASLLAEQPPQIAAAHNAYFAWIGVLGPEKEAPHAWGQRWFQSALRADQAGFGETQVLEIDAEIRQDGLRVEDFACREIESCLAAVARWPDDARAVLDKGRATLARGDIALAMPAYQEPWRPNFSYTSPVPRLPQHYRLLGATRFALAVSEGRHDAALDLLESAMDFHRRQALGAVTLLGKLLALADLRADLQLLNQYLQRAPVAARLREARIAGLLAPLPDEVTSLQRVIQSEVRSGVRLFRGMGEKNLLAAARSESRWLSWLAVALGHRLYLPGASANEHFRVHRAWLAVDALTGDAYRQAIADVRRDQERATADTYALRNPVGHVLVCVGVTDYGNYLLRRDDLLALHAMLALQFELLRKQTMDDEAIARAVAAAELRHPYTGAVAVWDKSTRRLIHAAPPGQGARQALAIEL